MLLPPRGGEPTACRLRPPDAGRLRQTGVRTPVPALTFARSGALHPSPESDTSHGVPAFRFGLGSFLGSWSAIVRRAVAVDHGIGGPALRSLTPGLGGQLRPVADQAHPVVRPERRGMDSARPHTSISIRSALTKGESRASSPTTRIERRNPPISVRLSEANNWDGGSYSGRSESARISVTSASSVDHPDSFVSRRGARYKIVS